MMQGERHYEQHPQYSGITTQSQLVDYLRRKEPTYWFETARMRETLLGMQQEGVGLETQLKYISTELGSDCVIVGQNGKIVSQVRHPENSHLEGSDNWVTNVFTQQNSNGNNHDKPFLIGKSGELSVSIATSLSSCDQDQLAFSARLNHQPTNVELGRVLEAAKLLEQELAIQERIRAENDPHKASDTVRELFTKPWTDISRILIRTGRTGRDMDLRSPHLVIAFPDGVDRSMFHDRTFNSKVLWNSVDGILPSGERIEEHIGVITPQEGKPKVREWAEIIGKRLAVSTIGIGNIAEDYTKIRERFYQAVIAAALGPVLAKEGVVPQSSVYFFESMGVYKLMAYADPEQLEGEVKVMMDTLLNGKGSPETFLTSIKGVIRDRKGIQPTAMDAFLNRNTVLYHLQALEQTKAESIDEQVRKPFSRHDPFILDAVNQILRANLALDIFARARVLCDIEHPAELRGYKKAR